jgi:MFS family permease
MFKKVMPLSAILSLRFLGLFLVLPVLSAYALTLEGATPFLVGIIVGGYALTQAIFQVPFGTLSDKIGRKPTILVGLLIFLIGSLICAYSDNIYMLMFGRLLQGVGAIGSVIPAMISDLVEERVRAKAMAIMGATIALSFALSMAVGPIIGASYGVDTLFIISAVLALLAIVILFSKVPTPPKIRHIYHNKTTTKDILKDKNLLNMSIANALQKGLMSVAFVIIPIVMINHFDWSASELWKVYIPAMIAGLLAMAPAAIIGEKKNNPKLIFSISVVLFMSSFFLMGFASSAELFIVGVISFFIAFNMMEPLLQSLVSKFAKVHQKGAALGISNAFAYVGTFIGGTLAGVMLGSFDREILGALFGTISLIWLLWTLSMKNPLKYSHLYLSLDDVDQVKLNELEHNSIAEWYINESENMAIVKYESQTLHEDEILEKIKR